MKKTVTLTYEGSEYSLSHGSVVIAAIASSTNASNPSVMLGAGNCFRFYHVTLCHHVAMIVHFLAFTSIMCGHVCLMYCFNCCHSLTFIGTD